MCGCYLCQFCVQAHHRQRKTSDHRLVPVDELAEGLQERLRLIEPSSTSSAPSSRSLSHANPEPTYCELHKGEKLQMFCKDCSVPVCNVCTVAEHVDHEVCQLEDINVQYSETLRNLLVQIKPLVGMLNESIKNIEFMMGSVREQARVVADEVCGSIDTQMRALQDHKPGFTIDFYNKSL